LRLLDRPLTYSRPMKYPVASRTITTRTARDGGRVPCVAILEEYLCDGKRCRASSGAGDAEYGRAGHQAGYPEVLGNLPHMPG
jgi:hypothetical protein